MFLKALDVFNAYNQNKIPEEKGYIVSSFFNREILYSKFEIILYYKVKSIYLSNEGLTFHCDGYKFFILFEPPTYPQKSIEPFKRQMKDQIPLRFSELEIQTGKDSSKVMINKNPILTFAAFTILKPMHDDFTFIFYDSTNIEDTIGNFFEKTFFEELQIPNANAKNAAGIIQKKLMNVKLKYFIA